MSFPSTIKPNASRLGALALLALGGAAAPRPAAAQTAYGLSPGAGVTSLVTFQVTAPGTFTATLPVTGVASGQTLVGLDARPNTGELFALGYNPTGTQAQLYNLNRTTAVATPVGAALTLDLGPNPARIGFDFNPTVDRIRVTGSNNANVRLNPNTGALAATDTNLAYAAADANAGQTPGVGAVAYSNSYIGATATTLYDVDEAASRLTTQIPPNNGTLNTVGALGVTTSGAQAGGTDLDVYFNPTSRANQAYLAVTTGGVAGFSTALYTVNLATGATTAAGSFPNLVPVSDIALAVDRTVPAALTGQLVYALAGTNLLTFDSDLPGTIRSSVGVTGLPATQTLVGLDVRPATNSLYLLGYDAAAQTGQVYTLNAATGALRAINATPVALALGSTAIAFDFNPTVDRIRVEGVNRNNYRLNPNDGTITATDGQLAYATGDANASATPAIGAVAYTNSFAGATATTLYAYDQGLNVLAIQNPPNAGTLNTVGSTGLALNAAAPEVDVDIYSDATAQTNAAYLVANSTASANSSFYALNTATGATTLVGAIGNGLTVRDIAVAGAAGVTAVRTANELAQNLSLAPNPFAAGEAAVSFSLPRAAAVELAVYDVMGRRVATKNAGLLGAGAHTLRWNAGASAAPGLYFFRLSFDGQPAGTRQGVLR